MRVADGDVIPVGSVDVDVVLPDGHVAEGCPTGALERGEQHFSPVLCQLQFIYICHPSIQHQIGLLVLERSQRKRIYSC